MDAYTRWSALLFMVLTGVTVLFQLALSLGAPWGEWTLGGRHHGRLPGMWRLVPVVSMVVLAGFIVIVAVDAGFAQPEWPTWTSNLIWVVVGYCALGCIANAATPSRRERRLWLPVVALMLLTSLTVAIT